MQSEGRGIDLCWGPLECRCSKFVFENIWKSSYHKKVGVGLSEMEKPMSGESVVRFFTQPCGAEFDCRSCLEKKKLTGIFYFCIRDFITPMIRSICRPSINSTLQRAAFQMARFWNVLSNEMEKRCLYGAVMMHAAVLSLPYRRDVSFNVLQSRGPIRSHVAPGDWSLHGRRRDGGAGGGGGGERLGVSIIFFPFLSSSRQQAPAKWLWVPPTVKLIELVIRGGRDQHPASRKRVCNHSYISSWERNSRAPRRRPESAVSFLDKMSPDVAELHLTCVTLQQSVWDVLSRCRLSLEALLQRDLSADPSCQVYDGSCR